MSGLIVLLCTLCISGIVGNDNWQEKVVKKLDAVVTDKDELLVILLYLGNEAKANGGYQNSNNWEILKNFLDSEKAFATYAQGLLQEAKKQPVSNDMANDLKNMKLPHVEAEASFSYNYLHIVVGIAITYVPGWSYIRVETQNKILQGLHRVKETYSSLNLKMEHFLKSASYKSAEQALLGVYLSYETMRNIYQWWIGEISGRCAAKNVVSSCATVAGGAGGAAAGAALGSTFGPLGNMIGGVVGGIAGGLATEMLVYKLTQELFNMPKDEALKKAYKCLEVSMKATNNEINQAFNALSVKHNPDNGGSQEQFLKLQSCMGIIKVARGEKY